MKAGGEQRTVSAGEVKYSAGLFWRGLATQGPGITDVKALRS